jgi:hypothetical protein
MDHIENDKFNNSFIVVCMNCHANVSTVPFHRNNIEDTQRESKLTTEELKEAVFPLQSDPKKYK